MVGALALLYGQCGKRRKARQLLAELEGLPATARVPPSAVALACVGAGDDRAFEWLEKAIAARDPVVTHLPSMPLYDGLRSDPRFPGRLATMNL